MKYSSFFPKTQKNAPSGAESVNHQLLVRAGFMDQLMAGSWTLLPLGFRVIEKIKNIIREELNKTGAQELLMPLLHPKDIWDQTGRWSNPDVQQIMYQFKDIHGKEYGLSFTHEEIVMNLLSKYVQSYKDLPVKVYQFSTKFRNEPRAKSGVLRGREFMMKDLYSAHVSEEDMYKYYNLVKDIYPTIFKKMGLDVKTVEAAGGVFTTNHTHEFQVLSDVGEDTIYVCDSCGFAWNKEIFEGNEGDKCSKCTSAGSAQVGNIKSSKAIEVGNIFPLDTTYSEKQKVFYTDANGKQQPIWFASYGIGPTRVMGALVESFHDDKGIVWPKSVSPFNVHLISLGKDGEAEKIQNELEGVGIEVLFDDRDVGAGQKFSDADLIGIPVRLVISEKTQGKIEWKDRNKEESELIELDEAISRLK